MKKKLVICLLLCVCLSVLSGCCLSHQWQDATCEAPRTCASCGETEGEALGHSWMDATTESPKTCTHCAATEGERIVTDPRFTTAATIDIQGIWSSETVLYAEDFGLTGSDVYMTMGVTMELGNDGTLNLTFDTENVDAFILAMRQGLIDVLYAQVSGNSREEVDAAFQNIYGMTVEAYVDTTLNSLSQGLTALDGLTTKGVYYAENGTLHISASWEAAIPGIPYVLDGDLLILNGDLSGLTTEGMSFTRVTD